METVKRTRLWWINRELSEAIDAASTDIQRAIAIDVTAMLAERADWPRGTAHAVEDARRGVRTQVARRWLENAADQADDVRLAADDAGDVATADQQLLVARSYSAAAWAQADDPRTAAQDAAYHAAMGVGFEHRNEVWEVVRSCLAGSI